MPKLMDVATIDAQIRELQEKRARIQKELRDRKTRLLGYKLLSWAANDPAGATVVAKLLDELSDPAERALFDLPPKV